MTATLIDGAYTVLGWSLACGAWAFALTTYPLVLAYVFASRRVYWAFADSLHELAETWEAVQAEREAVAA